jgi:hypothetical protein
MSIYSSHAITADRVIFNHQTGRSHNKNVEFLTNADFDFKKPIILKENYRLYVDPEKDTIFFQKREGLTFVNKFSFKFS